MANTRSGTLARHRIDLPGDRSGRPVVRRDGDLCRLPTLVPSAHGALVLAASSEFLFIGIIAAGGRPITAVLAGLLVNARHLPFGLAVPDVLGRGWRRLLGVHLMNDETVVFAVAQQSLAQKRVAYWACGLGILISWPTGALLGAVLGSVIRDTDTFGLDTMFPAGILAPILPALRDAQTRRPALLGAALALPSVPFLPAGIPVLVALAGLVIFRMTTDADTAVVAKQEVA